MFQLTEVPVSSWMALHTYLKDWYRTRFPILLDVKHNRPPPLDGMLELDASIDNLYI